MRLFYYCYGSAHSSVSAANLHLGHLPLDRRPAVSEIIHQPLFDRCQDWEVGEPRHMGTDEAGNDIYIIGLAGGKREMAQALLDFLAAEGVETAGVRFEDVLQHAGVLMRIGGYSSRRLGLVGFGRPLCAVGVWLKYRLFAEHVRRVKHEIAARTFP
jgi:hypothetical protein